MEISHRRNLRMSAGIIDHILVDHTSKYKRIDQTAVLRDIHIDIRSDSAAVTHDTSRRCPELSCKRIRNMAYASVLVAVRIIDSLHTSAAWSIIFCSSHLHLSVVCNRNYRLDKSLSITSLAHDGRSVKILKRT